MMDPVWAWPSCHGPYSSQWHALCHDDYLRPRNPEPFRLPPSLARSVFSLAAHPEAKNLPSRILAHCCERPGGVETKATYLDTRKDESPTACEVDRVTSLLRYILSTLPSKAHESMRSQVELRRAARLASEGILVRAKATWEALARDVEEG